MELLPWSTAQKAAFLEQQFDLQQVDRRIGHPNAESAIICHEDQPIGRICVERGGEVWLLIDIALLPEYRGAGIGGSLLIRLLADAAEQGKSVTLHVRTGNPACNLYSRHGFVVKSGEGVYWEMRWSP
jgi:ribosomal protein S18 acetylase RimI-like enzyme